MRVSYMTTSAFVNYRINYTCICEVQVRVMKGKGGGENKGYAFVMFRTKELASKAMEKLNNAEFKVCCRALLPLLFYC